MCHLEKLKSEPLEKKFSQLTLAPYLDTANLATCTHATITLRLDFWNVLYIGFPSKSIWKL